MPIIATSEVGIPFPSDTTPEEIENFREKAHAYFNTLKAIVGENTPIEVTPSDKAASYAIAGTEKLPPAKNITVGTLANLEAILTTWDQEVLDVSRRVRNYVTNKLIMESTDPDPRQRMKALELLGKISGVGLFSERMEVNVTHRTVSDIESELRKTLELYGGEVTDVTPADPSVPKRLAELDLDEELGCVAPTQTAQE